MPASGCGRWRSGATSRPGGWPRCSGRASSTPTSSSGRSAGASRPSATSTPSRRRPRAILDAYTEGVNAWLDGHRGSLGLAFLAAGVTPEPWTDLDTIAWGKVQAWNLGGNFDSEVFRYLADAKLGDPARTDELFPAYREDAPVITPTGLPGSGGAGATWTGCRQRRRQPRSRASKPLPVRSARPKPPPGARSPVSARASSRPPGSTPPTASPRTTGSARTTGSSAPGCRRPAAHCSPTIRTWASRCRRSGSSTASIAGPSRTPARTTSRASRSQACPASSSATTRASRGARPTSTPTSRTSSSRRSIRRTRTPTSTTGRPSRSRSATSRSRSPAADPVDLEIRSTVHGPILNDVDDRLKDAPPMAIRWTANLEPDRTFEAILGLNTAASFQDFRASLSLYGAPAQNFVYADVDGHIGYQFPGYVPIRSNPDDRGDRPVRGDDGSGEWTGRIPFDDLPWQFDPEDGVIVTANNAAVDADYPHFVAQEWDPGFRAERILDLIGQYADDGLTVDEMRRIQYDDSPLAPRDIVPLLEEAPPRRPTTAPRSRTGSATGRAPATRAASAAPRSTPGSTGSCATSSTTIWARWPATTSAARSRGCCCASCSTTRTRRGGTTAGRRASPRPRTRSSLGRWTRPVRSCARAFGSPDGWSWGRVHTATFREATLGDERDRAAGVVLQRGTARRARDRRRRQQHVFPVLVRLSRPDRSRLSSRSASTTSST